MKGTKIIKAYCDVSKQYYSLEIKQYGSEWKVVDFTHLTEEEAQLIYSEIRQPKFDTAENLLPCQKCGSRTVGGCGCSPARHPCRKGMKYEFDCVYCSHLKIDYSLPSAVRGREGEKIVLSQGKEFKVVTFSNVTWRKFDTIPYHPSGAEYNEPAVHVIANEEHIEFHGYNISEMNEGVRYTIGAKDDFEIECDVDTSTIQPHPGGKLYISLGVITANLNQNGGSFYLDGKSIGKVGSKFKMRLSLTEGGKYEVFIDGAKRGETFRASEGEVVIVFGFMHNSHHCAKLSHAYVNGIKMRQAFHRN